MIYVQRDRDRDFDPDPDADRERRSRGLLGLRERDLKDENTINLVNILSIKAVIQSLERFCPGFWLIHE